MRIYNDTKDEREHSSGWMNISNVLAGILLLFFLFLAIGLKYLGDINTGDTETSTTTQETGSETTEPSVSEGTLTQEELLAREAALDSKIAELAKVAGIRSRIIADLETKIKNSGLEIDLDMTTGDVRLSEALLFGVGVDTISRAGQDYLKIFVPIYISVILSEENRQYIDQITIEGHTDDSGTYLDNLALSQRRAVSVATYIFQNDLNIMSDGETADSYFAISGRSFSIPVENGGVIDKTLSRRVEFKFRLKDAELIEQMLDIYKGDN